jgi:hypothetical protein
MFLPAHPDIIFADEEASKYIDGIGVHWYWNKFFWARRLATTHEVRKGSLTPSLMQSICTNINPCHFNQRHPDKFILPTEVHLQ